MYGNKNIESWHELYPNGKRKGKNERYSRFLFFSLLDELIELGYEEKVFVLFKYWSRAWNEDKREL